MTMRRVFQRVLRVRVDHVLFAATALWFCWVTIDRAAGVAPVLLPDSQIYRDMADKAGLGDARFWLGARPMFTSLVLKLVGGSIERLVAVQLSLHLLSWLAAAMVIYARAGIKWLGIVCGGGILLLGSAADVSMWTPHVLSESLTLSLLPILLVLGHEFVRSHDVRYLTGMVLAACIFATIKDVGAYVSLGFCGVVLAAWLMRLVSWRHGVAYALALVAFFGFASYSAEGPDGAGMEKRWIFPLINNIGQRVLVDPGRTEEFRRMGMPIDAAVLGQRGKFASADGFAAYNDSSLGAFREWLVADGKQSYMRSLRRHPRRTIRDTWAGIRDVHADYLVEMRRYQPPDSGAAPGKGELLARPGARVYRGALIMVGLLALAGLWRRRLATIRLLVLHLALGLPIALGAVISINGDTMEMWRHASFVFVMARLWLLLLLFALANLLSESLVADREKKDPIIAN